MYCSKCGANNLDGQTFCGSCGSPLNSGVSTYAEPQDHYQKAEKTYRTDALSTYATLTGGGTVRPKSYLAESIIVTIVSVFCCSSIISLILGIIAIVKASSVDTDFLTGNISTAIRNSDAAKQLTIWAAVIAVTWWIVFVIFLVSIGVLGSLAEKL